MSIPSASRLLVEPRMPARSRRAGWLAWALALLLGCTTIIDSDTPGSIKVVVATTGDNIDPDGYLVMIGDPRRVPSNGSVVVDQVTPSDVEVLLDDIAPNCVFVGRSGDTVTVPTARQVTATFALTCMAPLPNDLVFDARRIEDETQVDLFRVNASGSGLRNLTQSPERDFLPVWKPDGTRIAFLRESSLALMDPDGTNLTVLGVNFTPWAWSPDGTRLAGNSGGSANIYVVNADGTGLVQVTNRVCMPGAECGNVSSPSWSPDGTRLVYQVSPGFPGPRPSCWVIDVDGTDSTQIKDECTSPAWSPDGTRIAFAGIGARLDNFNGHILLMSPDGSATVDLSAVEGSGTITDTDPSWSPDGHQIAFLSDRPVPEDVLRSGPRIFIMNADGTGVRHVTASSVAVDPDRPTWGPAGP